MIPKELGTFPNSVEAWRRRLQSGGARALMTRDITRLDTEIALKYFADWTDRVARGELPFAKPERPQDDRRPRMRFTVVHAAVASTDAAVLRAHRSGEDHAMRVVIVGATGNVGIRPARYVSGCMMCWVLRGGSRKTRSNAAGPRCRYTAS